ncbi:MAG: flavin reductase family protein [Oscillospiraceae bacterium]|nr:flavin reductase family protein [Oscillospiraceae bacterium]
MRKFFEINPLELNENVFRQIGRDWMLVTAGNKEQFNTMTASWGGLGVLWNTNVSFIFIRPSRYTYEFIEREKYYSLSFLSDQSRRALQFCGSHSGRDSDKMAETGLTPLFDAQAPYFEQCRLSLICRKMYYQDMDASHFLDTAIAGNYLNGDYHRVYVGEIVKVLQSEKV